MRVFLDSNVWIAAFATRGLCADVVQVVLGEHDLVAGERLVDEVERVLNEKLRVSRPLIEETMGNIRGRAVEVAVGSAPLAEGVDPDDGWILAEAAAGGAEVFVTGDRALLQARLDVAFPRLSPRQFWERLRSGPGRGA